VASTAAGPEFLSLAEARARVLGAVRPLAAELLPLAAAVGRALASDVIAPHGLPPFRNSSMDGFALRAAEAGRPCRVVETIAAGTPPRIAIGPGEASRIMTGAMIPEGADAVVPVEDAEMSGDDRGESVRARIPLRPGQNVREAGHDLAAGDMALARGREFSPHDLALAASLGIPRVPVGSRPTVALISTGDELLDVEAPLTPGAIRDSNLPMLASLLACDGIPVIDARRVGDSAEFVAAAVRQAWERADIVITIGGVSAGDFDPVKQSLAAIGDISLWRVAMKPGRPQAFGSRDGRLFFGLPGNPASVACVFEVLVRPALRAMQGFASLDRPRLTVRAAEPVVSRAGRTDFVRVRLTHRHGEWWASPIGEQVSGHLAPQSRAHGLLEVPGERDELERGESARVLLWRWPEHPES
jgi:molybdopterin molybdotransferase